MLFLSLSIVDRIYHQRLDYGVDFCGLKKSPQLIGIHDKLLSLVVQTPQGRIVTLEQL